ncbi:MAG: hypothetical protein H7A36_07745 [Chlamydiales bacterium]|nr:hypothetical protein [Chlamydiales bacterium]
MACFQGMYEYFKYDKSTIKGAKIDWQVENAVTNSAAVRYGTIAAVALFAILNVLAMMQKLPDTNAMTGLTNAAMGVGIGGIGLKVLGAGYNRYKKHQAKEALGALSLQPQEKEGRHTQAEAMQLGGRDYYLAQEGSVYTISTRPPIEAPGRLACMLHDKKTKSGETINWQLENKLSSLKGMPMHIAMVAMLIPMIVGTIHHNPHAMMNMGITMGSVWVGMRIVGEAINGYRKHKAKKALADVELPRGERKADERHYAGKLNLAGRNYYVSYVGDLTEITDVKPKGLK